MFPSKTDYEKFEEERFLRQEIITTPDGRKHFLSTVQLMPSWSPLSLNFETMLFPCDENGDVDTYREELCERYPDKEEALASHEWIKNILLEEGVEGYEEKDLETRRKEQFTAVNALLEEKLFEE